MALGKLGGLGSLKGLGGKVKKATDFLEVGSKLSEFGVGSFSGKDLDEKVSQLGELGLSQLGKLNVGFSGKRIVQRLQERHKKLTAATRTRRKQVGQRLQDRKTFGQTLLTGRI